MNVLFLDQFNQPGGAQQCLLDLLPAVIERGWNAVAMLPGDGAVGSAMRELGIPVFPVRCAAYSHGYKSVSDLAHFVSDVPVAAAQIAGICRRHVIDLLYVNGPRLVPAACLASRRGRAMIYHCHSALSCGYAASLTGAPLRAGSARVVASSRYVARPIQRWLPRERIHIVYNGVAEPRISGRSAPGSPRIGVIGRIAPEKGQDLFLRAARILTRDLPSCAFVIAGAPLFSGPDYEREVVSLAGDMCVEFTGWLENVEPVLASLDLLVVPSKSVDATPRIVMQAFAAGVPVLAFMGGGLGELIADGRTGFLLPVRSPAALAEGIRGALLDPARLKKIASDARREWHARFQLTDYRRRILRIMESESKP